MAKMITQIFLTSLLLIFAITSPIIVSFLTYPQITQHEKLPFTLLEYEGNKTTITFEIKGFFLMNDSVLVIVEKQYLNSKTRYYVNYLTRNVYYPIKIDNKEFLGFSGIYSILWISKRPQVGENIPLLEYYGTVIDTNETHVILNDYYGDELVYKRVKNIYVLTSYDGLRLVRIEKIAGEKTIGRNLNNIIMMGSIAGLIVTLLNIIMYLNFKNKDKDYSLI